MNSLELTDKLKTYLVGQIDTVSKSNPIIGFMKPFITRAVDKNIDKVSSALNIISDENGNIDFVSILDELIDQVKNSQPFTIKTSFIGDVEIGEGTIKLNIPMTDKRLIFNVEDLENFKDILNTKE